MSAADPKTILTLRDLAVSYGHIEAVAGIDMVLAEGGITALVGANGAGKSTTLMAISGLLKPRRGSILLHAGSAESIEAAEAAEPVELVGMAPHKIVRHGVAQVAEGRAILTTLSIAENLALGAYTRRDKAQALRDLDWIYSLFPVLAQRRAGLAGNLSGGEQQMLAIGRALMAKPRVLLLDEPSMGLAPLMVREIFRIIADINKTGLTILLVEQNVRQALRIARHGYVLENGRIVLSGSGAELLDNPQVAAAYLGG
ncbi:ABC transporter ATP-binding protein [Oxalobacteraceae bacterium CAVE-383]|nr:ABC transporter ATP-binding protein [Oxalobacteraceae bacterium CAVE-383]